LQSAQTAVSPSTLLTTPTSPHSAYANADTGATGHFIAHHDLPGLVDVKPSIKPLGVTLPDGSVIRSTHTALLNIASLPTESRRCHIFPALDATGSLLSIGKLCDSGCIAIYDKRSVTIHRDGIMILQGHRDPTSRLWMIDINDTKTAAAAAPATAAAMAHGGGNSMRATVAFMHAAMGSPVASTLITAVEKGFVQLPALTAETLRRHLPTSIATAKGHLDQTRQGQRSTNSTLQSTFIDEETIQDMFPMHSPAAAEPRCKIVFTKVLEARHLPTNQHFVDSTGRFPIRSQRGNEYCMIMLSADANYIHVQPMKSRRSDAEVNAQAAGTMFFKSKGFTPHFMRLDNETSAALEQYFKDQSIKAEYVAPHQHRANKAERAIRTFKNHFIAILSATDPDFPMADWDLLLPQAEMTINMLRGSKVNPFISAYQQLHGQYDFEHNPIAPPGIKVLIHEKPQQRETWAPHGVEGWYIGPAMQHHRCYNVLTKATKRVRITDTLSWHPHKALSLPGARPIDILAASMNDLTKVLQSTVSELPAIMNHRDVLATPTSKLTEALQLLQATFIAPELVAKEQRVPEEETPVEDPAADTKKATHAPSAAMEQRVNAKEDHLIKSISNHGINNLTQHTSISPPPGLPLQPQPTIATEQTTANKPLVIAAKRRKKSPAARHKNKKRDCRWSPEAPQQTHLPPRDVAVAKRGGKRRKESPIATYKLRNRQLAAAAMDIVIETQPENYREALRGPDRDKWLKAHSEEITRLVDETECIKFIRHTSKPRNKPASYYNPQVKVKVKNGALVYRVRGTYGGNKQTFNGKKDAQTAALPTVKILLNSVVSDDADWMTIDIADFYPTKGNTLDEPEFMWIELASLPEDIIVKYNLRSLAHNGKVLVQIDSALYGLRQAGRVAQDRLIKHLAANGYHQCQNTPCLFKHEKLPVTFSLVVDDFGIKYKGRDNAMHLLETLQQIYRITADWKGERFIGMTINHDKVNRTLSVSMPNYVQKALIRFTATNIQSARSPAIYIPPIYGSRKQQQAVLDSTGTISCPQRKKRIQQIIGTLLYYARAVDPTMLTALNKVASRQANPTIAVELAAERILSYAKTFPNAQIVYEASDMILCAHSDASYLSETKARSRSGGIFFLSNKDPTQHSINGSIDCISSIIPAIVASAAEAEYGALFQLGQIGEGIRATLEDMGHPQPPTRVYSDNKCAVGIANGEAKQKLSKAFDMKFHWIKSRVNQRHFQIVWARGSENLADIFTKALSVKDHLARRSSYVQDRESTKA